MLEQFLEQARNDETVYITDVAAAFAIAEDKTQLEIELTKIDQGTRVFVLQLPAQAAGEAEQAFVADYIYARIYNVLSSLGGRAMALFYDERIGWLDKIVKALDQHFGIGKSRKERSGYGKCINVLDRMLDHIDSSPSKSGFRFSYNPAERVAQDEAKLPTTEVKTAAKRYKEVVADLPNKRLCGLDVGGTDIKVAASAYGKLTALKEYDWFPADFTEAKQMIEPILWLVRLVRAELSAQELKDESLKAEVQSLLLPAFDKDCPLAELTSVVETAEAKLIDRLLLFDGIGLSFPDVVVKNKVVGGEVYKTRGMRNNEQLDYELEFAKITDLDLALRAYCKTATGVQLTNDGPMAAFTAAVEQVFSEQPERLADGVFAHTLGTELGTGWINEAGEIPDIPLEVYNYIIDIGSYGAKAFHADDIRSINNFNTGLAGTLQKYTSQSGAFRLACKTFPEQRPELWQQLLNLGYVKKVSHEGGEMFVCPTEPVDMRKPFLQHLMDLASESSDPVVEQIFTDIGAYLAVTWAETDYILQPLAKSRVMFGRLVKNPKCFELLQKGADELIPGIHFEVADGSIAFTPLMQQLEEDPHYTVAQFAQSVGAIYFGDFGNH